MMNWCVRTPSPQFMRCAILLFATVCLFRGFGAGIVYFDNVDLPDLPHRLFRDHHTPGDRELSFFSQSRIGLPPPESV